MYTLDDTVDNCSICTTTLFEIVLRYYEVLRASASGRKLISVHRKYSTLGRAVNSHKGLKSTHGRASMETGLSSAWY